MPANDPNPVGLPWSRTRRATARTIDLGFSLLAALIWVVFLLQEVGWLVRSAPLSALIAFAMCPFSWGKYWVNKDESKPIRWAYLGMAVAISAITVLLAVIILVRLVR